MHRATAAFDKLHAWMFIFRLNKQNETKIPPSSTLREKKMCRKTYVAKQMFQILNSLRIHCFCHRCVLVLRFVIIFLVFHLSDERQI